MWLMNLITDQSGNPSSKRITGFVLLGMLVYKMIVKEHTPEDMQIIEYLFIAVCTLAGISVMEFFKKK